MGLRTFKLLHVQRTKIILIVSQSAFECSPCFFSPSPGCSESEPDQHPVGPVQSDQDDLVRGLL